MLLRKEFEEKYLEVRKQISNEYNMDMGVATDILIAHVRNRNLQPYEIGNIAYYYKFDGCENLNYEELDKEIAKMDAFAEILREQHGFKE